MLDFLKMTPLLSDLHVFVCVNKRSSEVNVSPRLAPEEQTCSVTVTGFKLTPLQHLQLLLLIIITVAVTDVYNSSLLVMIQGPSQCLRRINKGRKTAPVSSRRTSSSVVVRTDR